MHLRRLILTNFKNYEKQVIDCSPDINGYVGLNGMGKTNLLDAIYYLCMGRSYFRFTDLNLVRHGEDFFRLEGLFSIEERAEKIVAKVGKGRKKVLERGDVPYQRLSEHIGLLPVVIITPDDTSIVNEGSEERRRFVDNTLSQLDPIYLRHLITYNKVLKQRNSALKQMAANNRYVPDLLSVYDEQLLAPAAYIHEQRQSFTVDFEPELRRLHFVISGEREQVTCRYKSQLLEEELSTLLQQRREKDRILQRTTAGIHRDDWVFEIEERPLKKFASQGQLKSFVLALKLTQYNWLKKEKKSSPLLLLDDIFDKLDHQRVQHLLELLTQGEYGQVFITDTAQDRLSKILSNLKTQYLQFVIFNGTAEPSSS
ncbi:MAG: DNA replication/repair protein RecF [Saprospiraceae bacterium]|nr:DNA replication/repair protein RecF [Saprospiraceae bacterium]